MSLIQLNTIEISKKALLANYNYLAKISDKMVVAPVLKRNAYGHGYKLVAKILDKVAAPFLCVDSLYEADELLKSKIKTPVLVMGYINPNNLNGKKFPYKFAVYDKDVLTALSKYQENPKVHIFVDTGMHREGINLAELPEFIKYLKSLKNIQVEGLMSHLGAGDNKVITERQLENFEKAKQIVEAVGLHPKWVHISASTGMLHYADYQNRLGNLARCGIALYGLDPEGRNQFLQPVLQLKTILNQIKTLQKGERVGYDFTYLAEKNLTIGILPLGYADGLDRRLSNQGVVLINNTLCPIIGRVSMNITIVDISNLKNPKVGDPVIVFSSDPTSKNSIHHAATASGTIGYDFLVGLAAAIERVVV